MTSAPTTTAREFIAAILSTLRTHFAGLDIQIGYGEPIDPDSSASVALTAPWLLLDVTPAEIDTTVRRRPGRVAISHVCLIQCALSVRTEQMQIELAEYASNVLTLVSAWDEPGQRVRGGQLQIGQRWGLGEAVEPPSRIACYPGALNSLPHGFDALLVEWEQTIYRPERVTASDPLPTY
jgi:hypothetical protein